ncbi:GNAT family N-acetyltransferase [Bacillus sp. FJAT-50079]|uniref:GNAT family N-acetyltransferase n=1 Tax=Bacillus sp. FJAT-50079 TaxID=2833577 RepID=UPI001BCA5A98|nr:GNAT family N-acetyltransferase [Bacillus sp. FJAT-50079]MBS4208192.1 GNAT family N-acetyltransferase [Bacillus sp. FJAT-50079]
MQIIAWDVERLDGLVALWNQELVSDFPMRSQLFQQNSFNDHNVCYDSSAIAINEKDEVIGFIVAKRWLELMEDVDMDLKKGWIQVLLIDQAYRGKGIGSALLEHAETKLKAKGIEQIQLGGDPWHYFPGIPDQYKEVQTWAEKKGYGKRIDTYDLLNKTDKQYLLPDDPNVKYSLLEKSEEKQLLSFMHRCFPGRWEYEAMKYFELDGNGREYVVLKKNDQIVGFCRINDRASPFIAQNVYWAPLFQEELGGIGPLGIDANERGHGYGLAIVQAALYYLQQRQINTMVIDWTTFLDFYGRLDFEAWKKYGIYLKG